jgi:RNA polymerase sigma factor (sigma-70 family)
VGENTTERLGGWFDRLRRGDDKALDELIVHFQHRLTLLARKMLRGFPLVASREDVTDVLQSALLRLSKALKALARQQAQLAETPILRGVDILRLGATQISRELLDLADYHRRRPIVELPSASGLGSAGSSSPATLADWTEFHRAAASLPEPLAEVFDLLWYCGLSQDEAATLLGVSARTVRSRNRAAKQEILDALGGTLPGS